ncbi:MAG: hypothetical protein FWG14_00620 [Peptococcaceae bacterium]|nr:hypothetical protein [Peptococcaceae bacterium]
MYSRLPSFVLGFHGCDEETKKDVLYNKKMLSPSRNPYDWLGGGIYFWENSPARAMSFARLSFENPGKYTTRPINNPAVLGAVIDLGRCLNLLDSYYAQIMREAYDFFKNTTLSSGEEMPKNEGEAPALRRCFLDCAVIETLHSLEENRGVKSAYDTVRAAYIEQPQLYEGSGFYENTHIQLCIRNENCIKAFFDPRMEL